MKRALVHEVFTNPIYLTACGFGTGLVPKAPGTVGTMVAIPIFAASSWLPVPVQGVVLVCMFMVGCFVCDTVAGSLETRDPGVIVWDEIVGYCVAMFMIPMSFQSIVIGFAIFRMFDILKPWPISWVEKKFSGGFGIMIDDVVAGFGCNAILHILVFMNFL